MVEPASATFWEALVASDFATFVRENAWAYPLLETLHMIGLALTVGGIIVFDLRLLGLARDISLSSLARHVLRFVFLGIAINVSTGLAMFSSDAVEFSSNASLQVKLVLIGLALLNAGLYQAGPGRSSAPWDRGATPPVRVRIQGALSIALWLAVITAGRMMAYLK